MRCIHGCKNLSAQWVNILKRFGAGMHLLFAFYFISFLFFALLFFLVQVFLLSKWNESVFLLSILRTYGGFYICFISGQKWLELLLRFLRAETGFFKLTFNCTYSWRDWEVCFDIDDDNATQNLNVNTCELHGKLHTLHFTCECVRFFFHFIHLKSPSSAGFISNPICKPTCLSYHHLI